MIILIVDDDEISFEMLRHALTQTGHEVVSASDGREALEVQRRENCRLVISDWEMPEMTGVDLCRAIRRDDLAGYVYVILLSARGAQDTVEGLSAGADDFMAKPFDPAELAIRVRIGERVLSLETRDLMIFAMAKLAESRDPETGAHLERVCSYCKVIANHLASQPAFASEVDAAYAKLIYLTSPLHDIGKVAIPDCVLLKPGRLSDREFSIMKEHAMLGARTLEAALKKHPEAGFLRMAMQIAATHHERFDGTGYPNGLKGDGIPLCGRIVALADVYDALTTKRVYKSAFTHDIARSIIVGDRGTHFDPDVVDAFIHCEPRFMEVRERYAEVALEAA